MPPQADSAIATVSAPKIRRKPMQELYTAPMKHHLRIAPTLALLSAFAVLAPSARAEVTRVEVTTRAPLGQTGYEKIVGIAHFAVDPRDPRNAVIADIDKAPVNAAGKVEFSGDICILRPLNDAAANGIALVDVVNRGRKAS